MTISSNDKQTDTSIHRNLSISKSIDEHLNIISRLNEHVKQIEDISDLIIQALKQGHKMILMGNGGSASDAQHIAAELVGRFSKERHALKAISLSTDTSVITSIANDYGYASLFSRQIEALANPGDVVVGISTSGNSQNVLRGLEKAKAKNCKTIGLLGRKGGDIKAIVDISLVIDSNNTARIQEAHILVGHLLCEIIDNDMYAYAIGEESQENEIK